MKADDFTTDGAAIEADAPFQIENSYALAVDVDGDLKAKAGTMVAYTGNLSFIGQSSAEGGLTGMIKEAATNEGTPIMSVEGTGRVFLADDGKKVQAIKLEAGESITVNGEDVLAFDSDLTYEITKMDSLAGAFAGGFTNVRLEGPGYAALTTHGDPIVQEPPVTTDPSATVAWSNTTPNVEVNKSLSDMVGQESGERFQMEFTGDTGYVLVQPMEEHV